MPFIPNSSAVVRAKFEPVREMAFGAITSSFTQVGSTFSDPFSIFYVQNFTDVVIDFSISFEGTDVTFSLASGGIICGDMSTNNMQISSGESAFCKYRTGAPTSGFVQVSAITPV
jgi:hypothetical protein